MQTPPKRSAASESHKQRAVYGNNEEHSSRGNPGGSIHREFAGSLSAPSVEVMQSLLGSFERSLSILSPATFVPLIFAVCLVGLDGALHWGAWVRVLDCFSSSLLV